MEYMRIHIHANIIVHIIVSTIVSDLWLEFLWLELILTSPKKTAVGAEKEMKLWSYLHTPIRALPAQILASKTCLLLRRVQML